MYKKVNMNTRKGSGLASVEVYEGETIEQKVNRVTNNKEPIKDGAPIIYTERKDGARPEYNIRTDRFEIALDAMDVANRAKAAQREGKPEGKIIDLKDGKEIQNNGETEPIRTTDKNQSK